VIRKIETIEGMHPVYDIEVEGSPCFIANELCVHNSSDPNIQNQPKHGDSKEVRRQIRPGGDLRIVACDYSGIQARNVAMESRDPRLVKAFWDGYDIHGDWAHRIARHAPQWLKGGTLKDKDTFKIYRQKAKNGMVFASFFGAGAATVGRHLSIPEEIARDLIEEFWDSFPKIKNWHLTLKENYHSTGYVEALSGFRRHAPVSYNEMINTPIQSDEAIIICDAMARLSEKDDPRLQPNIEVHDDLTFILPKHEVDKCVEIIVKEMLTISFPWINVPLGVEVSVGKDWYDMEKLGEFTSDKLGLGPVRP
jgi:DNA polymerase-1